ncbi:MAG: CheW protein [candidate division CPR2 bacterium GW2011_GWC1_39_9]|uniref:CheW protein n=1 Tax=candidate division CPR2 bacterium GW2011_GWC2_39_10 TaxID=1618345 RepID=A0A0G0LWN9_UNCC2|nr:MAG: CheW protein [candidate division CPR2 bacterium GW2011_GWC2_39_10]KKR36219.1 MAG: CheW protein [candidate division CPR2 bacterium GW2011_GWC1_39_9]
MSDKTHDDKKDHAKTHDEKDIKTESAKEESSNPAVESVTQGVVGSEVGGTATPQTSSSKPVVETSAVVESVASVPDPVIAEKPTEAAKAEASKTNINSASINTSSMEDSHETEQVVVFKLGNEEYAAPILEVQEIIPTGDITHFPNVPVYIAGIINVRGTVATVINLSQRFNLTRTQTENIDRYIILTESNKALYGVMVDEVTSVMKIPKSSIKASQGQDSKLSAEYINGVAIVDERVILILNFGQILDEEAITKVAAQAQNS